AISLAAPRRPCRYGGSGGDAGAAWRRDPAPAARYFDKARAGGSEDPAGLRHRRARVFSGRKRRRRSQHSFHQVGKEEKVRWKAKARAEEKVGHWIRINARPLLAFIGIT